MLALEETDDNWTQAAQIPGIYRFSLWRRLKRHVLDHQDAGRT